MRQIVTCLFAFSLGTLFLLGCSPQEKSLPTPVSTTIPIPQWHIINGNKVNIWLPNSFDGGNPKTDTEKLISRLRKLGPDFNQIIETLQSNHESIDFLAYDTNPSNPGLITNVVMNKESIPESLDIDSYLNSLASNLSKQYQVLEQGSIPYDKYPTGRLVSVVNSPKGNIKQVLYAFRKGSMIWRLVFTTPESEYNQRISFFNQSAQSLIIEDSGGTSASSNTYSSLIMLIGLILVICGLAYGSWQNRKKSQADSY